jgi:DNA-binding transcriptional MerR regulator
MPYDRKQICSLLVGEGYEVSERTLRYWESKGQIPRSRRIGRKAVYEEGDLDRIRLMAATRPKAISNIRRATKSKSITSMEIVGNMLVLRIKHGGRNG